MINLFYSKPKYDIMTIRQLSFYVEKFAHTAVLDKRFKKSSTKVFVQTEIFMLGENGTLIGPHSYDFRYWGHRNVPYIFNFSFKKLEVMKSKNAAINRNKIASFLLFKLPDSTLDTKIVLFKIDAELKINLKDDSDLDSDLDNDPKDDH